MRNIILAEFISLDGVMEAPEQWHFPFIDEEIGKSMHDEIFTIEALLLGRVTYDIYAATWPARDDGQGVAGHFNSIPKYVVSTTLESAGWNNSHLIRGNVAEEIDKLKRLPGGDIVIHGSADLANSLMRENLIDEYRLMIHPVVVGRGKRLFADDTNLPALSLVDTKTYNTGVVVLTYVPKAGEQA
ncbi:MAG: dihydrofolate reductase family protein [Chloroflexota bacterium]|nr:dihydrofolate reductase family protein [Chloroflexota bacterium]